MSKVSPFEIIRAHFDTLRNDAKARVSITDWIIFYGVPALLGSITWLSGQLVTNEVFSGSGSIFGIFVGLLLNVQVAIFGIFLRKPGPNPDVTAQLVIDAQLKRRNIVLKELNANIAYLILSCCFAIVLSILFLGLAKNEAVYTGILVCLYAHIILNILMTVKRAFLLFDAEYQTP